MGCLAIRMVRGVLLLAEVEGSYLVCEDELCFFFFYLFFNDTATTEIYTRSLVGSVRCV